MPRVNAAIPEIMEQRLNIIESEVHELRHLIKKAYKQQKLNKYLAPCVVFYLDSKWTNAILNKQNILCLKTKIYNYFFPRGPYELCYQYASFDTEIHSLTRVPLVW